MFLEKHFSKNPLDICSYKTDSLLTFAYKLMLLDLFNPLNTYVNRRGNHL